MSLDVLLRDFAQSTRKMPSTESGVCVCVCVCVCRGWTRIRLTAEPGRGGGEDTHVVCEGIAGWAQVRPVAPDQVPLCELTCGSE